MADLHQFHAGRRPSEAAMPATTRRRQVSGWLRRCASAIDAGDQASLDTARAELERLNYTFGRLGRVAVEPEPEPAAG